MKSFSFRSLLCVMGLMIGIAGVSAKTKPQTSSVPSTTPKEAASEDHGSASNLSGNWQMSWTGRNGDSRQAALQLHQDGSSLTGTLESDRRSVSVRGSLRGNQVSITIQAPRRQMNFAGMVDGDKMSGTTERGRSWTATRQ